MPTPSRATTSAQKPAFQPTPQPDADADVTPDAGDTSANYSVEPSTVELNDSDVVDESDAESTEDPYSAERERYNARLDELELDRDDSASRLDALELLVLGLCDTVLGSGVRPQIPANREADHR